MTIKGLTAKIVEKKGKNAQIEIDGQIISIPKENLPANSAEGGEVTIYFMAQGESAQQEKKLAKSILEEILNGN